MIFKLKTSTPLLGKNHVNSKVCIDTFDAEP